MATPRPIETLGIKPGITRDLTPFSSPTYLDGDWVRFYQGLPQKIGGYREISRNHDSIIRGSFVFSKDNLVFAYGFGQNKCYLSLTTQDGSTCIASPVNLGIAAGDYNFQVDSIFDSTGGGTNFLLVHPQNNLSDLSSSVNTNIYYSIIGANPPSFSVVTDGLGNNISVSGGIVVLHPYVFAYGNDGLIKNSNQNKVNDWEVAVGKDANEVNVAYTKIVKGLPIRGGGPAGLFWSLNSLIKVSYVGGSVGFKYDIISSNTSVLSSNGIVEYDGMFFWPGVDRFYAYTGTVKELPNPQNLNWFFANLNWAQRSKVWAMKVPRFGEIWWFFPSGDSEECDRAVIYNVRESTWYDTRCSRSAGSFNQVFPYPLMYGSEANTSGKFSMFAHEWGKDAVQDGQVQAIKSYFETSHLGLPGAQQDQWTSLLRVEPDFVQSGNLSLTVIGREHPQSPDVQYETHTLTPDTEAVDLREQHRIYRVRVESFGVGGHYQMGRTLLHTEPGDLRS